MARGKYKGPKRGAGQRLRGQAAGGPTQEQEDAFRAEAGAATQRATMSPALLRIAFTAMHHV